MSSKIEKKDLKTIYRRYLALNCMNDYPGQMHNGYTFSLLPVLDKIYKDNKEELEELEEFVNSILENPEGTCIGFPYEMEDESNRYLEERKIVGIIVHHNADIKFSMN